MVANTLDDSATVEVSGKIMVAVIIVLFLVIVFVLFLHLYAKWFWWRIEDPPRPSDSYNRRHSRRRRFVFNSEQEDPSRVTIRRGLDPAVLMSLPVFVFGHGEVKDGLECAVCLCELVNGEKARILPKCNHGFHVDCIDMWFQSHSTCPLCRSSVSGTTVDSSVSPFVGVEMVDSYGFSVQNSANVGRYFPTNVLFWGNQTQVSSGDSSQFPCSSSSSSSSSNSSSNGVEGRLVIDIPSQSIGEIFSPCSHSSDEETKSPLTTRLRSLKRLLSRENRVVASTPTSMDVEQGTSR